MKIYFYYLKHNWTIAVGEALAVVSAVVAMGCFLGAAFIGG